MNYKKLNKKQPIILKNLESIINDIHEEYHLLTKLEVIFIIKSLLEIIRELILSENTITLNNFLPSMKLIRYNSKLKVRISTPLRIKKCRKKN